MIQPPEEEGDRDPFAFCASECLCGPFAEKYSDSMYIKFAPIIEQMDSSSALKPLKLRTTNAGIQNGLYCAICARFDWSSREDRSLVLCLGWLRGYLQGEILGAYREYQSVHLIRLCGLDFIVFQVAVKIMKGFPDSEASNVRFYLTAPTIPCIIFYIVYFSGDFVEKSRFGRVSITLIYCLY